MICGIALILLSIRDVNLYTITIREDGPIENASALFWYLAALIGVFGLATRKGIAHKSRWVACFLIFFYLLCGNEEVSWGQRLFGFGGPEELIALNKQHETNLHNIGSISIYSNVFFLFTLAFFWVLPWINDRRVGGLASMNKRWRNLPLADIEARRVYAIGFVVWLILGIRFGTLGFHPYSLWGYYTQMDDEVFELYAAYAFFVFSLLDLYPSKMRLPHKGRGIAY